MASGRVALDYAAYSYVLYALRERNDDRLDWWMHCAMVRARKVMESDRLDEGRAC